MAHIDISRSHALGLAAARHAAEEVAARLRAEHRVAAEWRGDALHVSGHGITGRLDASATHVRVTATLGLLARPFRHALHREIESELDRAIRSPRPDTP
jgi:putative polyhydroxyalkanoate system protein